MSGAVIAFSGTVCATLLLLLAPEEMTKNLPIPFWVITIACLGALLSGFLVGSLHAWLINVVNLPPFVATLSTLVGLRSFSRALVAYANKESTQISVYDPRFRYLSNSVWIPALLCVVLGLLVWLLMSRTVTGRHLYAMGGNEGAAKLSGIRTENLKWLAYCLSAMLSSLAGILLFAEVAVIEPVTVGKGYELNAIAAAVVGGCSLQGGVGTIPGTLLGALFLRVVMDGVAKVIKVSADVYEGLIVGSVVVFAVAFTQLRQARRQRLRWFAGSLGVVTIINLTLLTGALVALFLVKPRPDQIEVPFSLPGGGIALLVFVAVWFIEGRKKETSSASTK